jgi:hypothetical protein
MFASINLIFAAQEIFINGRIPVTHPEKKNYSEEINQ